MSRPISHEEALAQCASDLHGMLQIRLATLGDTIRAAARAELDAAVEEAKATAGAEIARLREADAARTMELERRIVEAEERARHEGSARQAAEIEALQKQFEQTLFDQLNEALQDASRAHTAELARVRAQAAQATALEVSRARAAVERELGDEIGRLREALERAKTEGETLVTERVEAALAATRESATGPAAPAATARQPVFLGITLVRGVRALETGRTPSEVLDTLGKVLVSEVGRLAILVLRGSEAEIWRLGGFGSGVDCGRRELYSSEIDTSGSGPIVQAIDRGEPCLARGAAGQGSPARSGLRFAELADGRVGLAVPLVVGGHTVAVVYADDAAEEGRTIAAAWPELVEILARHAARCLDSLSRGGFDPGFLVPPLRASSSRTAAASAS